MQKYLVGGAVRDHLLSLPVRERDWVVVGATPQELIRQGYRQVGRDFPVFLDPVSNEQYALARTEKKIAGGHQGFSVYSSPDVSLEADLLRRDLTINAIAQDQHGALLDPCGGQKDIQKRILRHISPAFSEDPLRVLRVARFAARFWHMGFTIAPETLALMSKIADSDELSYLSKQRIWQETRRALASAHPEIYILVLWQINALQKLAPALANALADKQALLKLAHLRAIKDCQCRYVALAMLAAETDRRFDLEIIKQVNASFAIENKLQALATLTASHFTDCSQALALPVEVIYRLLLKLDAFRRQQRCRQILKCADSLQTLFNRRPSHSLVFLKQTVAKLNRLSLPQKQCQALAGKARAQMLGRLRCQAISRELDEWSGKL